jgi:V8-like Glu-specific endopeptidase
MIRTINMTVTVSGLLLAAGGLIALPACEFAEVGDATDQPGDGDDDDDDDDKVQIIGGTESSEPGVVAIFAHLPGETTGTLCSGTVVSDTVVLTAAHCVHPALVAAGSVFEVRTGPNILEPAAILPVAATYHADGFDPNNLPGGHDVAVVVLAEATGIAPTPVNFDPAAPSVGATVRQVGYGIDDPDAVTGIGIQREVTTELTDLNELLLLFGDESKSQCSGDSGGPSLLSIGGVETIIGVSSFGPSIAGFPNCKLGSFDARTDLDAAFIQSFIGAGGGGGQDEDPDDGASQVTCTASVTSNGNDYAATCLADSNADATATCTCTTNGQVVDVCEQPRNQCSVSASAGEVYIACCDF